MTVLEKEAAFRNVVAMFTQDYYFILAQQEEDGSYTPIPVGEFLWVSVSSWQNTRLSYYEVFDNKTSLSYWVFKIKKNKDIILSNWQKKNIFLLSFGKTRISYYVFDEKQDYHINK